MLLEEPQPLDLRPSLRARSSGHLRLPQRHLGAADVEDRAGADRDACALRELELRLRRDDQGVLQRRARLRLQHGEVLLRHLRRAAARRRR